MQEILTAFREKSAEFATRHRLNVMEVRLKRKGMDNGLEIRCPFEKFTLSFVWMYRGNHAADLGLKNILSCRLYFDDELPVYCGLYDIIDMLDENDFRCYFFPYIESPGRFTKCFDVLLSAADKYLSRIIELADDEAIRGMIIARVRRDVCAIVENSGIFELSDDSSAVRISDDIKPEYRNKCIEIYHAGIRVRFGGAAYNYYLCGDYRRAFRSFAAFKNHTYYEKRLLRFIGELIESGTGYDAVDECANSLNYGMCGHAECGVILRIAVLCALAMPFITLGYMSEYYTTVFFTTGKNIIFNTANQFRNSLLPCLLAGMAGTILLGIFLWLNRQKLYFGRKDKNLSEHMIVRRYELLRPTMQKASTILYLLSVVYVALAACDGYAFDERGFYDRSGLFSIQGVYYNYDDVDEVRVVEYHYLLSKKRGYSFRLHDGTVIDMCGDMHTGDISRHLQEVWKSSGINVIDQT